MAYAPQNVNTTDFLTPSLWNSTQAGIAGIKEGTLATLEPTTNETWSSLIFRNRTALISAFSAFRVLRATVDGVSNIYFHCVRRTSDSTMWMASRYAQSSGTPTAQYTYYLSVSSSSGALRRIKFDANGFTGADLSSETAESALAILGLNNNE